MLLSLTLPDQVSLSAKRYRARPTGPICCHITGTSWTSRFFRTTCLYPSLHQQRLASDPLLLPFDGAPPPTLSKSGSGRSTAIAAAAAPTSPAVTFVEASNSLSQPRTMVYEHGRWRLHRPNEKGDASYREWKPRDRVKIIFYCH